MQYDKVLGFAFAWLFRRETWKYVLIVWAVSLLFTLLTIGGALLVFGGPISSFMLSPSAFISNFFMNPGVMLAQLIPLIIAFAVLFIILSIAVFFVNLYIFVLMYFYGFRTANLSCPKFSLPRLLWFFILQLGVSFLVVFSWVHKKVWMLAVIALIGLLLLPLVLINPVLAVIPAAVLLAVAIALIVFPLYLFFKKEPGPDAVVTNRYFLLFCPALTALFVIMVLLSFVQPIAALAPLVLFVLLFIVYFVIVIYNSVRASVAEVIFLNKGTAVLESLRGSLSLTQNKAGSVFLAFLVGGLVGLVLFLIAGVVGQAILTFAFLPLIPVNLFGLTDLIELFAMDQPGFSLVGLQPQIDMVRYQVAQSIAENVWGVIVTPFTMLYGVFLTIAVYLQLIPEGSRERPLRGKTKAQ